MSSNDNKTRIDFVIIWVDGSDPEWQKERKKYSPTINTDNSVQRFRDWNNLRFWFRGVEEFAPWVNKVHFVTWGHVPKWLNTSNPKINIVKHSDYIPEKYLPTFSSIPIELNLHRIKDLSENFVYFNDDTFIISPVKKELFFKNDIPCDSACLNVQCYMPSLGFHLHAFRDIGLINEHFNMHAVIKQNPGKWFNLKYGTKLLRTLALLPCPRFPGMWQHHLPSSFKKSVFEEVWRLEYKELDYASSHKFRHMLDYNQWLFREWQIAKGEFYPRKINIGKNFTLNDIDACNSSCEYISKQKGKLVCINDYEMSDSVFESEKKLIIDSFNKILPNKSSFEI